MKDDLLSKLLGLTPPPNARRRSFGLSPFSQPSGPPPPTPDLKPVLPPPPGWRKFRLLGSPLSLTASTFRVKGSIRKAASGDIKRGLVLPDPDDLGLAEGRQLRVAILYADLRGFSSMVVTSPKRSSLVVLEVFVSEMARLASLFRGEVVDCAGDRILAAFPQPLFDRSLKSVHRAVACGLWMQTVMDKVITPQLSSQGYSSLSCGIGIDHGTVVVARVGIRNRNKLIFLGSPAVVAAKLEEAAGPGETLMSPAVYSNRPSYLNAANNWVITPHPPLGSPQYYKTSCVFTGESPPIAG